VVDLREYADVRLTDTAQILAELFDERPRGTSEDDLNYFAQKVSKADRPHLCMLDSAELLDRATTNELRRCLGDIYQRVQQAGKRVQQAGKGDVPPLALMVGSRRDDGWTGIVSGPRVEALRLTHFSENVVKET
jgi:hypothetical protein